MAKEPADIVVTRRVSAALRPLRSAYRPKNRHQPGASGTTSRRRPWLQGEPGASPGIEEMRMEIRREYCVSRRGLPLDEYRPGL